MAAKIMVKCAVCQQQFDRNNEPAVKHTLGRRYAHQSCFPQGELVPVEDTTSKRATVKEVLAKPEPEQEPDSEDYVKLKDYINALLGSNANWGLIVKQIKSYKEKGYTYSGMLKTLVYVYDIQKNDISKAKGIGIIPISYQDANRYYYSIWLANQKNKKVMEEAPIETEEVIIKIPSPQPYKRKSKTYFTFLDEEDN